MARLADRHPANVDGAWFVDTRCIDCGTCRELVPDLFGETGIQSVVQSQPRDPEGEHRAWLAAAACPTASIGRSPRTPRPDGLFPLVVDGPVSDLGHTSEDSFGATSYLVERPDGNLMVDSPVFTRRLTGEIDARGGLAHVLLTHRDDVADAQQWAERYGARVWIHRDDLRAAPYATDVIDGHRRRDRRAGDHGDPGPGPHPRLGRLPRRRPLAVHGRLARLELPPRGPRRLPGRLLVLVVRAHHLARPAGRPRHLRVGPPGPRPAGPPRSRPTPPAA